VSLAQTVRTLKIAGLQGKLSDSHILIRLFSAAMEDKYKAYALRHYIGSISRVFYYVENNMKNNGTAPKHWSDMLLQHKLVIDYFQE